MIKRIFASVVVLLACASLFLAGCESLNGPAAVDNSLSLTETFDVTSLDGQTNLLKSAGVKTDSANAFFVLRWSKGLRHFQSSDTVAGHASAVAYEQPATLRDRNASGLDMGIVSVLIGQGKFDLPKLESTLFGVRYGLFGGPHGCPIGFGGRKDAPRGGHGGGPRGGHNGLREGLGDSLRSPITIVNIPFVGGGTYQFTVSGSDKVAAMVLDIKAPARLVQITGRADKDSIDATQALTINWDGDATANNTVLVLAPARKPGRFGDNFGQPAAPIFQVVDAAAGSYTISAQTLQDLLSQTGAKAFSVHLVQASVNETTDAKLGKILVSAGADDQVMLIVK
jgi:hypothetical protein